MAERRTSVWLDSLGDEPERASIDGRHDVDVAIVGGGYSALWTAYYLTREKPALRVAVLEAERIGFGASGRNGGWCSSHFAGVEAQMADPSRRKAGVALQRAAFDAVDEVGRVCRDEGIACGFHSGGMLHVATNRGEQARLRGRKRLLETCGFGEDDHVWLDPAACRDRLRAAANLGGLFERHAAAVDPARLVRGLAAAAERRGVAIFERSRVEEIGVDGVMCRGGAVRADIVVRATEGYTPLLPGAARDVVPIHSWMIATEPLSDDLWDEIGLPNREVFGDGRRMVTYGQRTEDGRIAFGSRGTYRFGSRIEEHVGPGDPHFAPVRERLVGLLPCLAKTRITHAWGGPLAAARDGRPFVFFDRATGRGALGGYLGSGVAASNLTGRTLADLILGRTTDRTRLSFVRSLPPRWEIEPFRWLGVTLALAAGESADAAERRGRTPRLRDGVFRALSGG